MEPGRKRKRTPYEEIHSAYSDVLHRSNTGQKRKEAIRSTGYPVSTFYKWRALAEVKIMDAEVYGSLESSTTDGMQLLNRCKEFLAREELTVTAATMRRNGDLLS